MRAAAGTYPLLRLRECLVSDEAVLFGRRGQTAGLRSSEPAGAMAGDHVVNSVAQAGGYEAADGGEGKRGAEEREHAEDCVGADADGLVFDENDGADTSFG